MEQLFYLKTNKKLFLMFLAGMFLPLLFTVLILSVLQSQLGTYFLSIFEKKSIDGLTSYHESMKKSINSYFVRSVDLLEKLSKSDHFIPNPTLNNSREIEKELRLHLSLHPQFLTLGTINSKGIVTSVVSQQPVVEKLLGQDLSDRDYFKAVMKTGKIFISKPIVGAQSKITQINISVPLRQNGKLIGILGGFISLKQLTDDMDLSGLFYDRYSVLVDTDGLVLTGSIPDKDKLMNLSKTEPLFDRLKSVSNRPVMLDDYNYKSEKVFAMGEKISVVESKDIYLMCFQKKNTFTDEQVGMSTLISKLATYLIIIWIAICGGLFMIYSVLMYRHEKK